MELHPFWRQDELLKFCQSKGIHVSAHTPLGVPGSSLRNMQDDSSSGEHEVMSPGLPIAFTRSRSGHAPMLKISAVEAIGQRLHKTPAQVINYFCTLSLYFFCQFLVLACYVNGIRG